MIAVAAVVTNPWYGRACRGPATRNPPHGSRPWQAPDRPPDRLAGSGDAIEAYGKAALCGTACELEHCSALIHTLRFGNFFREAVGAKTYLGFTNTRGPPTRKCRSR
jgi:hypothetical protein